MIKLERPLVFLDIESTGCNVARDRIIDIAGIEFHPENAPWNWSFRVNPGIPIPAEATAVHGIKDADVQNAPPFADVAAQVHAFISARDIAGFGVIGFDVPRLWDELHRAGLEWELEGVRIIDAGVIMKRREERSLSAAVKFYLGREHDGAHGALADAQASHDVLAGQLERYKLPQTVEALAEESKYEGEQRIDLAGKFLRDKDGDAVYNFGKNRGVKVRDDMGICRWMLDKDFPAHTLITARKILDELDPPSPLFEREGEDDIPY